MSGQYICLVVKGGYAIGVSELIFLALKAGTAAASSGVAECDRFWSEVESLIDF